VIDFVWKNWNTSTSYSSPEGRDELLQSLLIAAPRGGEAMIGVLHQLLLCQATEELLDECGYNEGGEADDDFRPHFL
jgi:hypothetical protein